MTLIDVAGHFGSRLSYATIAGQLCRALQAEGQLGQVLNLDDGWLDDFAEYRDRARTEGATHAVLLCDPRRYIFRAFADRSGPSRVAVFASPNTDTLSPERAEVCAEAGLVIVPSMWCAESVARACKKRLVDMNISTVPLGVSELYMAVKPALANERRFVHFSTDFAWPGRKGTEELIEAWALAKPFMEGSPRLTIHVPTALYESVHFAAAKAGILHSTKIVLMPQRGSTDAELVKFFESADVIVQPSRAEGFGMIMLAACVAGVPLVTTSGTGQDEFLADMQGWLGVPTAGRADHLAYEDGKCPVVRAEDIATALVAAAAGEVHAHLMRGAKWNEARRDSWTWKAVMPQWLEALQEWSDG